VRHGAYTFRDLWPADETARAVTHGRAVMRTHSQKVAISHTTSVLARPVDTWGLDLSHTHVTRLDGGPARSSRDIAYHQGGLGVSDLEVVQGVATTVMARAVVETITIHPVEPGLVLADSALHKKLVTLEAVQAAYLAMKGWPGTQHADLVMRLMDGRAESVGESRSRHLMWSQGLPLPELQYEVRDGGTLLGTTDFAWPKYGLLGEFDGKVKYGRYLRPGEAPGDAVFREKKREDLLRPSLDGALSGSCGRIFTAQQPRRPISGACCSRWLSEARPTFLSETAASTPLRRVGSVSFTGAPVNPWLRQPLKPQTAPENGSGSVDRLGRLRLRQELSYGAPDVCGVPPSTDVHRRTVTPALLDADLAAFDLDHPAGDPFAFDGREPGDDRRDVGGVHRVES
jgi:hypothetical protein